MSRSSNGSLELEPAVGARALDERRGRPARGARQLLVLAREHREVDGRDALGGDGRSPVTLEQRCELGNVGLLDQEVGLGPSTFAAARRATDHRRDPHLEAAVAQSLHLGDRSTDRRDDRFAARFEECFGLCGGQRFHGRMVAGGSQ